MGAVLLPRHLCAMCVCVHVCMRQGKQDRVFSCTDLHLCCACLCMCLIAAMIVYAQICFSCVWTYVCVCVCSSAQMPQGRYPASNKDFWGANLRGGQPEDWQGHEVQSTGSPVLCFSDLRTLRYTTVCVLLGIERCWCHVISIISFLKYNMHVCVFCHTHRQKFSIHVPNLILDDVICSCCVADRQFPHHNMRPYGLLVRPIDRWMTPMRASRPSP